MCGCDTANCVVGGCTGDSHFVTIMSVIKLTKVLCLLAGRT